MTKLKYFLYFFCFFLFLFTIINCSQKEESKNKNNKSTLSPLLSEQTMEGEDDIPIFTRRELITIGKNISSSQYPDPNKGWASTGGTKQTPELIRAKVLYFYLYWGIREPNEDEKNIISNLIIEQGEYLNFLFTHTDEQVVNTFYEFSSPYVISYFTGRFIWDYSYWIYYLYKEVYGNDDTLRNYIESLINFKSLESCNVLLYGDAVLIDILTSYYKEFSKEDVILTEISSVLADAGKKLLNEKQPEIESIDSRIGMAECQIGDPCARILLCLKRIEWFKRGKVISKVEEDKFKDYIDSYFRIQTESYIRWGIDTLTRHSTVRYNAPLHLIEYFLKSSRDKDLKARLAWGLANMLLKNQCLDGSWEPWRTTLNNVKCTEILLAINKFYPSFSGNVEEKIYKARQRTLDWLEMNKNSEGFWPLVAEAHEDIYKNIYELLALLMIFDYTNVEQFGKEAVRGLEFVTDKLFHKRIDEAIYSITDNYANDIPGEETDHYIKDALPVSLSSSFELYSDILGLSSIKTISQYQRYIGEILYSRNFGIINWSYINNAFAVMGKEDMAHTIKTIIVLVNLYEFTNKELKIKLLDSLNWIGSLQKSDGSFIFDVLFHGTEDSSSDSTDGGYKEYHEKLSFQFKGEQKWLIENTINAIYALSLAFEKGIDNFDNEIIKGIEFVVSQNNFECEKLSVYMQAKLYSVLAKYPLYEDLKKKMEVLMKKNIVENNGYEFYFYVHGQKVIDSHGGPGLFALLKYGNVEIVE
jgi:hypothetical protein